MHSSSATRLAVVAGLLAAPILAGCGGGVGADSGSGTRVVASFYPLAYVAERVAGEHADVANLTKPGQEPHDLELSVEKTAAVSEADVVLYSEELQPAVAEAVEQSEPEHVVEAGEESGSDEEHFWLDTDAVAKLADRTAEQLGHADPDHAEDYTANAEALRRDLEALDRDYEQGLAGCRTDTVVVSHDAFGALEKYGLDFESINGLSPDDEPSPAHIRELREVIEDEGVTTVFSEELASPEFAESLAQDAGVETAVLDPIEGLGDDTADEDYLSLMRNNLVALQKANGCR